MAAAALSLLWQAVGFSRGNQIGQWNRGQVKESTREENERNPNSKKRDEMRKRGNGPAESPRDDERPEASVKHARVAA